MTDTPDPIPEAIQETENATPAPAKPRSPFLPILGGVVAAVMGFGVAQVVPGGWPAGNSNEMDALVAAQTREIAALSERLGQLAESSRLAEVEARVSAMEAAKSAEAPIDLLPLSIRIEDLERKLAELALRSAGTGSIDQAALTALQSAVSELRSEGVPAAALAEAAAAVDAKMAEADAKIAAITIEAESIAKSARQRAALTQILAAVDSGAPFASAMPNLSEIAMPDSIAAHAQSGLPSLQSLRDSFPDHARQALEASLQANPGQSWSERIGTFLRVQTGARSLELREGTNPDALLSQAEAALAMGDVAGALAVLDRLPPEGQTAMLTWREKAMVREDAATALRALLAAPEL